MAKQRIVIELEVPDGSEIESLEAGEDVALGVAREASGQVLQQLADERQEQIGVCPECGGEGVVREGRRERELYTRMGEVRLRRQRRASGCGLRMGSGLSK